MISFNCHEVIDGLLKRPVSSKPTGCLAKIGVVFIGEGLVIPRFSVGKQAYRVPLGPPNVSKTGKLQWRSRCHAVMLGPSLGTVQLVAQNKASFVDSSLKSSLGSKPSVSIKGDYARLTIR